MSKVVKSALTRRRRRSSQEQVEEPAARLVLVVEFAIAMVVCLCTLELVHVAILGCWNSEIFAGITGLSGSIVGLIAGKRS